MDNTSTSFDVGLDESTKRCVQNEQQALDHPQAQWLQFAPSDRCTREETNVSGVPQSSVDVLTCLQAQQLVKKLEK